MRYEKHIFVCTNQKAEGKVCCGEAHGMALVETFREAIKEAGLQGKVRAQRAGCLDVCKHGPAVVVYPDGIFYGKMQKEDVKRIMEEHILGGNPVAEKIISDEI